MTSSLFLPSLTAYLSPASSVLLLRKHLLTALSWWVARGRPALNIRAFYAGTSPNAAAPPPLVGPSLAPAGTTPNPWLALVDAALVHPDDHIAKVQRALLHYARVYGEHAPGAFGGALEGAEVLDGTLFARVAQLSKERMAVPGTFWDLRGFFI